MPRSATGGDLDRIGRGQEQGVTLEKIFLTHGHVDHCAGAAALSRELGIPIEGPQRDERFWIEQLPEQTRRFGFGHAEVFEPERWLENGDTVQFGNETLGSITAGHTGPRGVLLAAAPAGDRR